MSTAVVVEWFRDLLWTAILAAGPTILAAVAVGLFMAVLQAATQVNDASVSFAPKAIAAALSLGLGGPWIMQHLVRFATEALTMVSTL